MFLQISSCNRDEVLPNLFIERNEEHVPWITEENVQLEILTPTDSEATGKRYFVPNGDRGEKWLQFYFQGCDTGGILIQSEIKEREGKESRGFRVFGN